MSVGGLDYFLFPVHGKLNGGRKDGYRLNSYIFSQDLQMKRLVVKINGKTGSQLNVGFFFFFSFNLYAVVGIV